jgi:Ca2+-binding EF-hand superfamily protein
MERIAMSLINGISNNIRVFEKLASKQDSDKANTPPPQATESSKVTLSEDAKALANFTNKGIAVSMKEFDTPLTKTNAAGSSAQFSNSIVTDKKISKDDFAALLSSLGVKETDQQDIISAFDTNSDNTISHGEILKSLSQAAQNNSPLSQSILDLMDKNGNNDGQVSAQEYANISTRLYDAES